MSDLSGLQIECGVGWKVRGWVGGSRQHGSPSHPFPTRAMPPRPALCPAVGAWARIEHKAVIGEDVFVKVGYTELI